MIKRKIPARILCLALAVVAFQYAHAGDVNWTWCSTGEWDSGGCWGGFSSPDSDDFAKIRPDSLYNHVNVQIVPGDSNVAMNVAIYTDVADDTSRVTHSGGSLTIGTKLGPFSWSGGELSIGFDIDTGRSAYYLSDGVLSARNEFIASEGRYDAAFIQTGGANIMELLSVGAPNNGQLGKSFYRLDGGTVQADYETIGPSNRASFIHANGLNIVGRQLVLGANSTGEGFYNLFGGILNAPTVTIGRSGTATFNQWNGFHSTSTRVYLGEEATGQGGYALVDGDLLVPELSIGYQGTGIFHQTGGTATVNQTLALGERLDSEGTYNLSGGTLRVNHSKYGLGSGTFNLDGGILELTGSQFDVKLFNIGNAEGSTGNLNLGAGKTLTTYSLFLGRGGAGSINQTGGTIRVRNDLVMGYFSENESDGSVYSLSGGNVSAKNMTVNRCVSLALFSQTGGTTSIAETMTLAEHCGTATFLLAGGALDVVDIVNGTGSGNILLAGGVLTANNIYAEDMASFDFSGGTLSVNQFFGTLNNNGGNLSPYNKLGNQPFSNTRITGDYSQSVEGQMTIWLTGSLEYFDSVSVDGTANIAGELQVSICCGLNPIEGISWDVLTAETITGGFDVLNLPALSNGLEWSLNILTDEIDTADVLRLSIEPSSAILFNDGFE